MILNFIAWDRANEEMLNVDVIDLFLEEIKVLENDGTVFAMKFRNIELMQSTGLKDKNDKEIFEGDIVKPVSFARWIGCVKYLPDQAAFIIDEHNNDYLRESSVFLSQFSDGLRVLGNVYENPELLEEISKEK